MVIHLCDTDHCWYGTYYWIKEHHGDDGNDQTIIEDVVGLLNEHNSIL